MRFRLSYVAPTLLVLMIAAWPLIRGPGTLYTRAVLPDPGRLGWFREELRKSGEEIQIVVFTCRPLDYLLEGELVGDRVSERVGRVDLETVVDRVGAS